MSATMPYASVAGSSVPFPAAGAVFSSRSLDLMQRRNISDQEQQGFADILAQAKSASAGSDPKAFLNNLSPAEMELLRKVHSLAAPINVAVLDFEGAYNLLTAPGEARDLNNDGLLGVGIGKGWQYPPPNAPEAVKKAWEEATAGIPESEKWLKMAPFMAASISANIKPDKSGLYEPGEAGYRNIYAEPGFSYTRQISDILRQMERFKGQNDGNYQETREFLLSFLEKLNSNQAA